MRRAARCISIAACDEHLQLMCFQGARGRIAGRPVLKSSARKSLLTEPESLAIVEQYFDAGSCPIAKDKRAYAHRIAFEPLAAQSRQANKAAAKIGWLDRYQD
jgi:hypothetical protein